MDLVKSKFNVYNNFLSSIDLFKNIDERKLGILFDSVRVSHFFPGQIINLNRKEHDRCYIVRKGVVRLFRVDSNGNEIVICVYDKGDVISPMFLAENYNISAEFINSATLFYFCKTSIDEFAKNNHQFMLNLVSLLSNKLQNFMINIEMLKVKSNKEKVARYLARSKASGILKLRHPKALIASCLGMRPETFSRAVSELKREGIFLRNKTILLANGSELCRYCDQNSESNSESTCTAF